MITLNLKNGTTKSFNIRKDHDRDELNSLGRGSSKLDSEVITAIWLKTENHAITLPIPQRFRRVLFFGELLFDKKSKKVNGEKIIIQADDVRLTITTYDRKEGTMHRVFMKKVGKQRFNPDGGYHD